MEALVLETFIEILEYSTTDDVMAYRCANRFGNDMSKYHTPTNIRIHGRLRYLMASFPKLRKINMKNRAFVEDDFVAMSVVHDLTIRMTTSLTVEGRFFRHLVNLTSLDLTGTNRSYLTDSIFPHLTRLVDFRIDQNSLITDEGLSQLCNLRHLHLLNVSEITNKGLATMSHLSHLVVYRANLTDELFDVVSTLQDIRVTFGHFTIKGFMKLPNLSSLEVIGWLEGFAGIETLTKLDSVKFMYTNLTDADFVYFKHIKHIFLYSHSSVTGSGLHRLTGAVTLQMYRMPLRDEHLDDIKRLPWLKKVTVYECPVSYKKRKELLQCMSGVFFTEVLPTWA